jgi:uncharacterized protein
MYQDGQGVPADQARANALYQKACDADQRDGCYNIAFVYGNGVGVPVDQARATELLIKSCQLGLQKACDTLGRLKALMDRAK